MKRGLIFAVLIFYFGLVEAQNLDSLQGLNWQSLKDVQTQFLQKQKPIFVYFYSSDCDSCQMMQDSIFAKPKVYKYMNRFFYLVKLDIHAKESITFFDGTVYTPAAADKIHPLAETLLGTKNPQLPAYVCFSKEANGSIFSAYKTETAFFSILIYYVEEAYKTVNYEDYYTNYKKAYPEERGRGYSVVHQKVKWKTVEEAFAANKKSPRKIFLDISANWVNTCTMMMLYTYNNPVIADILNTYYYPVRFDATFKDTVRVFNQEFTHQGKNYTYHNLAVALLNAKMKFPVFLVFDEESKLIRLEQAYHTPQSLEPLLMFFSDNKNKNVPYDKFLKTFKTKIPSEKEK